MIENDRDHVTTLQEQYKALEVRVSSVEAANRFKDDISELQKSQIRSIIDEIMKSKSQDSQRSMTMYVDTIMYQEGAKINELLKLETGRTL